MTRELQRTTFNRSSLIRILSNAHPEIPDPKYDFGERLGQWLDLSDALTLYSVLNNQAANRTSGSPEGDDLPGQLVRVRRELSDSVHNDGVFSLDPAGVPPRIPFPTPRPNATADFAPYHRYYLAHQRDMNNAIATLRSDARRALARRSAAGRQLANLDAAFEGFLSARERVLLTNIPILLGKCFDHRYAEHRATLANSVDDPTTWMLPRSWLEAFCQDVKSVLLAEQELRLKPVAGLIAAVGSWGKTNETKLQ